MPLFLYLIPYYNKVFGVGEQYGELVYVQSIMTLLMFVSRLRIQRNRHKRCKYAG